VDGVAQALAPQIWTAISAVPRSHSNFHNRVSHNILTTAVRRHYARRELSTGILEVNDQLQSVDYAARGEERTRLARKDKNIEPDLGLK